MRIGHLEYDPVSITTYCQRWKIVEMEVFGSVLRDDFTGDSDVDILVTFAPEARRSLFDLARAEHQLAGIIGRRVDLVEKSAVQESQNWIRRRAILESARRVYAA